MTESVITGFIDESCKPLRDRATGKLVPDGRHYVAAAVITLACDHDVMRDELRKLAIQLGAPLHYRELTARQRINALRALADIDGWDGMSFETEQPFRHGTSEHHVRAKLVGAAFIALNNVGTTSIVLETRGHTNGGFARLNQKDHDVLRKLQRHELVDNTFKIKHDTKQESILAIGPPSVIRRKYNVRPVGAGSSREIPCSARY